MSFYIFTRIGYHIIGFPYVYIVQADSEDQAWEYVKKQLINPARGDWKCERFSWKRGGNGIILEAIK